MSYEPITVAQRPVVFEIYIVYGPTTLDYPGRYTCRKWIATPTYPKLTPTEPLFANEPTLFDLRRRLQAHKPGLRLFNRKKEWDRNIIEAWAVPAPKVSV